MSLASDDPSLAIFFEECDELLRDAESLLLRMEEAPGDKELLNRLFRSAHTIKGTSGMLGFDAVTNFTHALEDLLDRLRRGETLATREVIDTLLAALDVVKSLVQEARGDKPCDARQRDEVLTKLRQLAGGTHAAPIDPSPSPSPPPPTFAPPVADSPTTRPPAASGQSRPPVPPRAPEPSAEPARPPAATKEAPPAAARGADSATIRVPIEKVDRLVNLVGELVSTQSMVAQLVAGFTLDRLLHLEEAVTLMDRHTRELQERVMAIRMLPIKTLFTRFQRVVRDLAAQAGKQVLLEISGEETELDKTVIEQIGDPLTHLIRNAVDHGIEPPDVRRASGKPPAGKLRLSAYQQGGNIYIEVSDDGRGLDRDRILRKAVQQELVRADQLLLDPEVFALIFRPGFSTAEKLTEISGRGVGMDVVKRNVESLKGSITIDSEFGKGTTFRIKLPLTLAILDGQALQVGEQHYIIPLISIVESVRPQPGDVKTVLGRGEVVIVRGEYLPLLRLHEIFGVSGATSDPLRGLIVITDDGNGKLAFLVDELLGQFQVVIKSLETNFRKVFGVAGATILGDGRVALILDTAGLQHLTQSAAARSELSAHRAATVHEGALRL